MNNKPAKQLWLPFEIKGGLFTSKADTASPVEDEQLMEKVVDRDNLLTALRNVKRNGGSPGIDGMTVKELPECLKRKWPEIRRQLLSGTYVPLPVRRVEIPKSGGGIRQLGIPTVLDRFIQQALLQVLQQDWDATFSESSYGFRPKRSAHQAIKQSQRYLKEGYRWAVDMDLEKFFDRVNHDKLMSEVRKRVSDERVNILIQRFLRSGVEHEGKLLITEMGTPQGGPLSPLLANLMLDNLDCELERRGHRFVRYADDCNIYVKSRRAGSRVLKSVSQFLSRHLKLSVNEAKSAVDRPWKRQFLGFTFSSRLNRRISAKAIKRFKNRIREITCRSRGRHIEVIVKELRRFMLGWQAYFNFTEVRHILRELDSWVKRRLRCYLWKQWGHRGYRELKKLGVSKDLAWNTAKSAHGPWRLSRSPGLAFALTAKYFARLGLPRLFVKPT
ncbi:group II intron reverse transcriptase/maturase [Deltaproteobacteria bacterium]|nr:group II intron reverse transcriptase/maturase [Deltaproteobacteria bacterium]